MTTYCDICQLNEAKQSYGPDNEFSLKLRLCDACFCDRFEQSVRRSIAWWRMLHSGQIVMVGVSGIDSMTLINVFLSLGYNNKLKCCIIKESEKTHRDREILIWRQCCDRWSIPLVEKSFKSAYGGGLEEIIKSRPQVFKDGLVPCVVCALLRNRLLYLSALQEGASILAVGGHADDAACNKLGAYLFGEVVHAGPVSYRHAFPACQRIGGMTVIRPLVLEPKSRVERYARIKVNVDMPSYKCIHRSHRGSFKMNKVVNLMDKLFPGTRRILAIQAIRSAPESLPVCGVCGAFRDENGSGKCSACSLIDYLNIEPKVS